MSYAIPNTFGMSLCNSSVCVYHLWVGLRMAAVHIYAHQTNMKMVRYDDFSSSFKL